MKKRLLSIITCLATVFSLSADDCCWRLETCSECCGFDCMLAFGVGGGYRQDNLNWKTLQETTISETTSLLTEVQEKWNNLQMGIVETNVEILACDHYLFQMNFDYGWFGKSGSQHLDTTETTYISDVAQSSTETKLKSPTSGRGYNLTGGIGYQFNWFCNRFSFAPMVGYSYNFQKYTNKDYKIATTDEEVNYHNSYKYHWRGPWIGLFTSYKICCDWLVYFNYNYHWIRFRGTVDEEITLAEHPAYQKCNGASGNEFVLGTAYEFCPNWVLNIKGDYKVYQGNKGSQSQKLSSDEGTVRSKLRNLKWDSVTATIDVVYLF